MLATACPDFNFIDMSVKYLDYTGLAYFWSKIKGVLSGKIDSSSVDEYAMTFTLEDDSTVTKTFLVKATNNNNNN